MPSPNNEIIDNKINNYIVNNQQFKLIFCYNEPPILCNNPPLIYYKRRIIPFKTKFDDEKN